GFPGRRRPSRPSLIGWPRTGCRSRSAPSPTACTSAAPLAGSRKRTRPSPADGGPWMANHRGMRLRDLAGAVRERRASARELVAESLRRIDALDPDLGAVVALRADEALEDARALDAAIAEGADAGALAGLPLLVKDMTDVAGMRTTFGSRVFAGVPAAR